MVYYQTNNKGDYEPISSAIEAAVAKKQQQGVWHIQPNFLEGFFPQFTDSDGREYMIMTSGPIFNDYMLKGDLQQYRWKDPQQVLIQVSGIKLGTEISMGSQLLIFRLPKSNAPQGKAKFSMPEEPLRPPNSSEDGGMLWLSHLGTKRRCRITYEVVVWSPKRRRQGYLFCNTFTLLDDHD